MSKTKGLFLDILPAEQLKLWDDLGSTPNHFTLYGGTALALQLGHRTSIDFDFFSNEKFISQELYENIPYLKNSIIEQETTNTLTCLVDKDNDVDISKDTQQIIIKHLNNFLKLKKQDYDR